MEVYVSQSGKKYFVINGEKIYINTRLSKKEIMKIYNLLKKNMKITNSAKAVVNIHNAAPTKRRKRRVVTKKPFVSSINEANKISASGSTADRHPKDSAKKMRSIN